MASVVGRASPAIAAVGLDKSFGPVRAIVELDLEVPPGQTVAVLGPNGAGKTTAISLLLGLMRADRGSVRLLGLEAIEAAGRGLVGAVLQDGGLMPGVRVAELLDMLGRLYPTSLGADRVMAMTQLEGLGRRRVNRLSGGQTQRLRVAAALVGDPQLLVLDEPTAAMDVEARRHFWATMRGEVARGRTILFSTHHLEEVDDFADRVVVLAGGQLVADGTPAAIKSSIGNRIVRVSMAAAPLARLEALPGVERVDIDRERVTIRTTDSDATVRSLLATWPDAHHLDVGGIGLEEAFVTLTASPEVVS